jgi:serine/threonine protein phosphatase 1
MARTIAIGDIHGCAKTFIALLEKLDIETVDTIVLLGDYIDRGPSSKGVIHIIFSLQDNGFNVITLRGNHEQMLIDSEQGFVQFSHFVKYGGDTTLESFDCDFLNEMPQRHQDFFNNTQLFFEKDDFIFVHAGLNFNNENIMEDTEAMLWERGFGDVQPKLQQKKMIHGHTPKKLEYIINQTGNCINIDGGCVYDKEEKGYGYLVAYICETNEFVSIKYCE